MLVMGLLAVVVGKWVAMASVNKAAVRIISNSNPFPYAQCGGIVSSRAGQGGRLDAGGSGGEGGGSNGRFLTGGSGGSDGTVGSGGGGGGWMGGGGGGGQCGVGGGGSGFANSNAHSLFSLVEVSSVRADGKVLLDSGRVATRFPPMVGDADYLEGVGVSRVATDGGHGLAVIGWKKVPEFSIGDEDSGKEGKDSDVLIRFPYSGAIDHCVVE